MGDTDAGCRDLYECSCPELDEVIGQAKSLDTLSSRLKGAGWGGCTVSLIRRERAPGFLQGLKDGYFSRCLTDGKVSAEELDSVVLNSRPSS